VWGHLVESVVGAQLVNSAAGMDLEITYWRGRNREVDYVVSRGRDVTTIEVKSGKRKGCLPGIDAFAKTQRLRRKLGRGNKGCLSRSSSVNLSACGFASHQPPKEGREPFGCSILLRLRGGSWRRSKRCAPAGSGHSLNDHLGVPTVRPNADRSGRAFLT
jgi:hypothetical protein